jgi:hypothetical protein
VILVPAIVSFLAVLAGRWQRASRSDADFGSPGAVRLVVLVAIVTSAALVGVTVYADRAAGVSSGRALHAAVLAAVATAVPLTGYYGLAAWVRWRVLVYGCWVLSLFPLYIYAVALFFGILSAATCAPGAYDCPL